MLEHRLALYAKLEQVRERPLLVYITSARPGCQSQISGDSVAELLLQLDALPADTKEVDFLIVSNGGDPTVAWRMVSLIRERVKKLSVMVPQAAYSAATLIALGADEIVMHPHGNLGPTDPQITTSPRPNKDGSGASVAFGSEDLVAFHRFAREQIGLTDQAQTLAVFEKFCAEVGAVAVGVAARSSQLSVSMGEKLLQLHMGDDQKEKARSISNSLNRDYFHHGCPVSRSEAKVIGLPIAPDNKQVESIMWKIWLDVSEELRLREPFNIFNILHADPHAAPLFAAAPQIVYPPNLSQQSQQQAAQLAMQSLQTVDVPPTKFEIVHALMESARTASRFVTEGLLFAQKLPDQQIRVSTVTVKQGWATLDLPVTELTPVKRPIKVEGR